MTETAALIQSKLKAYRIIHLAMVMGSVVYGVVVVYIHQYAPIPPTITDVQTVTMIEFALIFYIVGLLAAAAVTRKKMLNSDAIFKRRETAKEPLDQPPFIANYLSSLFVVWALIEAITIGGIVLFLTSGKVMIPLIMISIAVLSKLANGPRREELRQLAAADNSAAQ
ncbi:hypothetical protein [Sulfurimonas sp. HSL3-7]|uniref:hypothetical protein n=1 Tax=Sulfonitrofixus jiaomeiensis TaxID=3131938 RepID=UPI0031F84FC4